MPPWLSLVHIQQCRNTVTWLVTIPLDVTRSSVIFVYSVFGSSSIYCIHCGNTDKGTSEVFVSLQPRAPAWWSALLLQLREFTLVGGNCEVYLPDKGTRSIWATNSGWVFYCKFYVSGCWNVNHAAKFKLSTSKYRSYWVGCTALWQYKSMLCFASIQLPPQKWKSMSLISDPTPKKKAEVCSKTWKKAKVWRLAKSM